MTAVGVSVNVSELNWTRPPNKGSGPGCAVIEKVLSAGEAIVPAKFTVLKSGRLAWPENATLAVIAPASLNVIESLVRVKLPKLTLESCPLLRL